MRTFCQQLEPQALEAVYHPSHPCEFTECDKARLAILAFRCDALIVEQTSLGKKSAYIIVMETKIASFCSI
jgi:hypothetical protein